MARSKFVRVLFLQRTEDGVPMRSGNMYQGTLYIYTEFWNNHKIWLWSFQPQQEYILFQP
jgi:hypothetical protein